MSNQTIPDQATTAAAEVKIDIGCGGFKRDGFIGLDYAAAPGVDHVLDLTRARWPFEDGSVDYVFSSHLFEHISPHDPLFQEIGRVCKDGATIEIWTPYAFTNGAFLYTHVLFLTEEQWLHICCYYPEVYQHVLGGRWLLKNINFVVPQAVEHDLRQRGFSVKFAIQYFKSVVQEFGIEVEFRRDLNTPAILPTRTYSHSRFGERFDLEKADLPVSAPLEIAAEPSLAVQRIASLEQILAEKNNHILQLENLIRQVENGRLMRLLKRFGR